MMIEVFSHDQKKRIFICQGTLSFEKCLISIFSVHIDR